MSDEKDKTGFEEDDGRTIANMNVEGMPWYTRESPDAVDGAQKTPMNKDERRMYIWAAVRAGLLIGAAFGVVFFLFILFCIFIWFR